MYIILNLNLPLYLHAVKTAQMTHKFFSIFSAAIDHPDYSRSGYDFDLALLKLPSPFDFTDVRDGIRQIILKLYFTKDNRWLQIRPAVCSKHL
jgi:hypothetical protein